MLSLVFVICVIVLCYVDVMESCCVVPNRSVVVVVGSSESLKSQERKKREKNRTQNCKESRDVCRARVRMKLRLKLNNVHNINLQLKKITSP